jgi:hypothetical protein
MTCPLCDRPLGRVADDHHLIPKTFKGKETVRLHKICHRKIHATFTERELLNYFHTVERLREHDEIAKFIKWVAKKDPDFYDSSRETTNRRGKRWK